MDFLLERVRQLNKENADAAAELNKAWQAYYEAPHSDQAKQWWDYSLKNKQSILARIGGFETRLLEEYGMHSPLLPHKLPSVSRKLEYSYCIPSSWSGDL